MLVNLTDHSLIFQAFGQTSNKCDVGCQCQICASRLAPRQEFPDAAVTAGLGVSLARHPEEGRRVTGELREIDSQDLLTGHKWSSR